MDADTTPNSMILTWEGQNKLVPYFKLWQNNHKEVKLESALYLLNWALRLKQDLPT